jgi:hypothetical protein
VRYDRAAAVGYARKYWDRPCDDGIFWRTDYAVEIAKVRKTMRAPASEGWEARFVKDAFDTEHAVFQRTNRGVVEEKEIQEWAGLADCAHFLTRCISAGGIPMAEISVPKMINHLKERNDMKVLAERVSLEQGQRVIDTGYFKKGDMLGYFNVDPKGDYGGARQYSHSTMFIGKISSGDVGRITCHTKSRFGGLSAFPDEWYLQSTGYRYTFIHIARDDHALPLVDQHALHGWWRHLDGGSYYYLSRDGRASKTMHAPHSSVDTPSAVVSHGYYFFEGGKLTIFWRQSGDVEVWRGASADQSFLSSVNGVTGTRVQKLFIARGHGH